MSDHHFSTPQPVELDIKVAAGDFQITSADGDESTVTIDGSAKLLDTITVELTGNRLTVEQHLRGLGGIFTTNGSATIRASVPHHSTVRVATAAGDTRLDGTFAGVDTASASGNIDVRGTIDGPVRTKTASGDTQVTRVSGDVSLETVSGGLNLESAEGSVSVKSVSGNVRVDSLREGKVTVNNVSGNIELGIAPGSRVDIDASSLSGDLESEVALSGHHGSDDDDGPMVVIRSNTVSGDFRLFRAR